MADVKSLFAKKKGKKKTNTLNTNVIPTSTQHIDAEALSTKTVSKADDGWADKTEKKKVVVSSGKSLGDIQEMKAKNVTETTETEKNSSNEEQDKITTTIKSGWGVKDENEENVDKPPEPPVVVEEKPKPFLARRPQGAVKPNTDSAMEFPTLDVAATDTTKKTPSMPATSAMSSSSSSLSSSAASSSSSRPKLALKARTAPLPEQSVPAVPVPERSSQEKAPTEVPVVSESTKAPTATDEPSWRGQRATLPERDNERDNRDSRDNRDKDDTPSSWRGQRATLPERDNERDNRDSRDNRYKDETPSSWRGQRATVAPPAESGGIKFGTSNGERPKLALKKRSVN